jgi:hypothetical protein
MPEFKLANLERAVIHVRESAPAPVAFAAEELQRYLLRMTGFTLRITPGASLGDNKTILLARSVAPGMPSPQPSPSGRGSGRGQSSSPKWRESRAAADGFKVSVDPASVTLAADSPRGVLSAAYALLEQFGCQWSLGAAHEHVPRLTASTVELRSLDYAPHFTVRGYCSDIMAWHYTQPEHLREHIAEDRPFLDWMVKSGANTFFFIRHPFDTQLTIPELLPDFERRGLDVEYGGHVIPLLLPRDEYSRHPDYFPQAPDGARTDHGNLCSSSAAALATAGANAVRSVREHPEMHVVHIWGADVWGGGWCHCPGCSTVSVQEQSLRVCNAAARALAEAGMARPVCYLAYHDTIEPATTLRPDENVTVEFAPRERCYGHALNDPECGTNRRYAAALERYVELFAGRARLFEYYGDAILFAGCTVPMTRVIDADLDYYQRLGIREITMLQFGAFSRWAYPLNFVTFAAKITGHPHEQAIAAHWERFGGGAAVLSELEAIMRQVVTYGDIRRPPRSAAAAGRVLARVAAALPRLAEVIRKLEAFGDAAMGAQAPLIRYTHAVLQGVQHELHQVVAGQTPNAQGQYADALRLIENVDAHLRGVWGRVDLPIIHSFYDVTPQVG